MVIIEHERKTTIDNRVGINRGHRVSWQKAYRYTLVNCPTVTKSEYTLLTIGLLAAFAIVVYSTVLPLDGPESFSQHSDNMAHLGSIISMTETGFYSTFNASSYLATPLNQIPVETSPSFYPEGWHIVCAMISSTLGVSAPMAENAANLAFAGSVFPLGICALSETVFSGHQNTLLRFGAIVSSVCFVAFPSGMYLFGPLYPNAASYCALPALLYLFIRTTNCIRRQQKTISLFRHCLLSMQLSESLFFSRMPYLQPP